MDLVLEYAARDDAWRPPWMPRAALPVILTYAHVNLCWQMSRLMLEPVCRHVNPHFTAWTPLAWLPGNATTLWAGSGGGIVMMFLASLLAGQLMSQVLSHYCLEAVATARIDAARLLRDWRVWLTAVLWLGWVPVPSVLAFVYQFEMWAITG